MPYTSNEIGFQSTDTSEAAAKTSVTSKLILRAKVLAIIRDAEPFALSSQEIADKLDEPYRSVQPRLSELRDDGSVIDSGERGKSIYNKSVIKWTVANDEFDG